MTHILYISYDGMLEPLGQSQVLAYLKRLANGRRIHLISFEKADDWVNVAERVPTPHSTTTNKRNIKSQFFYP